MTTTDDRPVVLPEPTDEKPVQIDQRTAVWIVAVLQAVRDGGSENYEDARVIAGREHLTPGDRLNAIDPETGIKVGTVGMSDPRRKATVEDREAFTAHMAATDPDSITTVESIDPERLDEALDVLRRHAPHLLVETDKVRVQHEKAALDNAAATNTPLPGVEVLKPSGNVSARLSTDGKNYIRTRIALGVIDALRELPSKES